MNIEVTKGSVASGILRISNSKLSLFLGLSVLSACITYSFLIADKFLPLGGWATNGSKGSYLETSVLERYSLCTHQFKKSWQRKFCILFTPLG